MAEVYGNVNVEYNPCKSIAQLKSAADYIHSRYKPKEILAQKKSLSIHPEATNKLSYTEVYRMAEQKQKVPKKILL